MVRRGATRDTGGKSAKNPPAHPMVPALAAELLLTMLQDDAPSSLCCWVPQSGAILEALKLVVVVEDAEAGGVSQVRGIHLQTYQHSTACEAHRMFVSYGFTEIIRLR